MIVVELQVRRYDPQKGDSSWWADYEVTLEDSARVLDALHHIKWELDGSLGFRRSCAHGVCGSDAMMINGVNRLACAVLCRDLEEPITVEPLPGFKVEKDLIVDMEPFFEGYRAVMPWLVNPSPPAEKEHHQTPAERRRFDDTTKCILCAACTSSCPVYWADKRYVGPAAIVNAHRFIFDSRDGGGARRLEILSAQDGAFRCRTIFNCTAACPRGIKVTEAIQEVKRAAAFGLTQNLP